jgi:hypothetical protein
MFLLLPDIFLMAKKYTNFDQILKDQELDNDVRIEFTKNFLADKYGITTETTTPWMVELSSVHDHDNEPKHFGFIKVGTVNLWIQLVKVNPTTWELSTIKDTAKPEATRTRLSYVSGKKKAAPALVNLKTRLAQLTNPESQELLAQKETEFVTLPKQWDQINEEGNSSFLRVSGVIDINLKTTSIHVF